MSELTPLDSDPSFTFSYLNSLNLFVSDLQCCVDSIDKSLLKIFSDASDVSDEIVLEVVELISQFLCEIISELRFLEIRLSLLSSLHPG